MKKCINGKLIRMTQEEIDQLKAENERYEKEFWSNIPYEEAVDMKIREKYAASQEFAILRQRDEKPTEYAEYYAYCEQCKEFVKAKKGGN